MNLLELGRLGVDRLDHFHLVVGKDRAHNLLQVKHLFVDHADILYVTDSHGWLEVVKEPMLMSSNTLVTKHIDEISFTDCSNYEMVVMDVADKKFILDTIAYLKTARGDDRFKLTVLHGQPNLPSTSVLFVANP